MTITVKYLASIAENLKKSQDSIVWQENLTPETVWKTLNPDEPLLANTICSLNYEFIAVDSTITDNAELAFFPPVTGG